MTSCQTWFLPFNSLYSMISIYVTKKKGSLNYYLYTYACSCSPLFYSLLIICNFLMVDVCVSADFCLEFVTLIIIANSNYLFFWLTREYDIILVHFCLVLFMTNFSEHVSSYKSFIFPSNKGYVCAFQCLNLWEWQFKIYGRFI